MTSITTMSRSRRLNSQKCQSVARITLQIFSLSQMNRRRINKVTVATATKLKFRMELDCAYATKPTDCVSSFVVDVTTRVLGFELQL
jgi:hypothetical protein